MFTVSIELPFCYAHRLMKHLGKCKYLHGHNGKAIIEVRSQNLTNTGMVIDFGELKQVVKNWIDSRWDHNFIGNEKDPLIINESLAGGLSPINPVFAEKKPYIMQCGSDPTAENMAKELFRACQNLFLVLAENTQIVRVTIWETDTCSASYSEKI